jgi:hypothetical protein
VRSALGFTRDGEGRSRDARVEGEAALRGPDEVGWTASNEMSSSENSTTVPPADNDGKTEGGREWQRAYERLCNCSLL